MKIALTFIKILAFLLALYILTQNGSQYVDINLFTQSFQDVNLLAVILVTLTIGMVLGGVFMAFLVIQSRSDIKALRKKNRQLRTELENLRNISIEEIPDEEVPQISAPEEKEEGQQEKVN